MRVKRLLETLEAALDDAGLPERRRAEVLMRVIRQLDDDAPPEARLNVDWGEVDLVFLSDPKRRRPHSGTLSIYYCCMLIALSKISGDSLGRMVAVAVKEFVDRQIPSLGDELDILCSVYRLGSRTEALQRLIGSGDEDVK